MKNSVIKKVNLALFKVNILMKLRQEELFTKNTINLCKINKI